MTLLNFETELDTRGVTRMVVREEVRVRQHSPRQRAAAKTHLTAPEGERTWKHLRDYVMTEIERRFGREQIEPVRLASIFKGFMARRGEAEAFAVAEYAFGQLDGYWLNRPITPYSFCKNSDKFFADPIAERIG